MFTTTPVSLAARLSEAAQIFIYSDNLSELASAPLGYRRKKNEVTAKYLPQLSSELYPRNLSLLNYLSSISKNSTATVPDGLIVGSPGLSMLATSRESLLRWVISSALSVEQPGAQTLNPYSLTGGLFFSVVTAYFTCTVWYMCYIRQSITKCGSAVISCILRALSHNIQTVNNKDCALTLYTNWSLSRSLTNTSPSRYPQCHIHKVNSMQQPCNFTKEVRFCALLFSFRPH